MCSFVVPDAKQFGIKKIQVDEHIGIRACSDCLAKRAFGVYLMHSKSRVLGRSVFKFDHIYSHLEGHRATSCFPMRIRFQSFSLHRVIFVRYVFLASVEPKVTIDT